jgi:hypothetical protein
MKLSADDHHVFFFSKPSLRTGFGQRSCIDQRPPFPAPQVERLVRGQSATPVQILRIPPFCRFTGAFARVILGAFDKGAHEKALCRSKSTHLTGRPDHPRPAKVGGAGCAAIYGAKALRRCSKALPFSPGGRAFLFCASLSRWRRSPRLRSPVGRQAGSLAPHLRAPPSRQSR